MLTKRNIIERKNIRKMKSETFWKDGFEGHATGGYFFRSFDLNKFFQLVEKEEGEVVGIQFEDNNVELIVKKHKKND